jgi:hypothetical protein
LSSTIGRNKNLIPGEVLSSLINGTEEVRWYFVVCGRSLYEDLTLVEAVSLLFDDSQKVQYYFIVRYYLILCARIDTAMQGCRCCECSETMGSASTPQYVYTHI